MNSQLIAGQKPVVCRFLLSLFAMLTITGCQHTPPEKQPPQASPASTSKQCPDISGIYYDLAVSASSRMPIIGAKIETYHALDPPKKKGDVCRMGDSKPNAMLSICSLRYVFDPTFISDHITGFDAFMSICPERTIEFKRLDNFNYDVITYKRNQIVSEFNVNLIDLGFRCNDDTIVNDSIGAVMFLDDGSLIKKWTYSRKRKYWSLHQWNRVGSAINPYWYCRTEHKEDNK